MSRFIILPPMPLTIMALAGALAMAGPAGAASNLHYAPPILSTPAGRSVRRPKLPITVGPTRPPSPGAKFPIAPIGPAKLPPQQTYPYAPGTTVTDHRNGMVCSYVVGNSSSWCQYWSCEHAHQGGHGHPRTPPPPWPYPSPGWHGACGGGR